MINFEGRAIAAAVAGGVLLLGGLVPTGPASAALAPASAVTANSFGPNWSGFSRTDGGFTAVHGTFRVPTVAGRCGARSAASMFVGIGGAVPGSRRFVQAGYTMTPTRPGIQGAWFELFGDTATPDPVTVPFAAAPGDSVSLKVAFHASSGTLVVVWRNRTAHRQVVRRIAHASVWMPRGRFAVADWITERPNFPDQGSPMARVSPVRWSGVWAARGGHRVGLRAHLTRHTVVGAGGRSVATASTRPRTHGFVSTWRSCR